MKSDTGEYGGDEQGQAIERILTALKGLKFGAVEITLHEGRIVQIERKEKQRLNLSVQSFWVGNRRSPAKINNRANDPNEGNWPR